MIALPSPANVSGGPSGPPQAKNSETFGPTVNSFVVTGCPSLGTMYRPAPYNFALDARLQMPPPAGHVAANSFAPDATSAAGSSTAPTSRRIAFIGATVAGCLLLWALSGTWAEGGDRWALSTTSLTSLASPFVSDSANAHEQRTRHRGHDDIGNRFEDVVRVPLWHDFDRIRRNARVYEGVARQVRMRHLVEFKVPEPFQEVRDAC